MENKETLLLSDSFDLLKEALYSRLFSGGAFDKRYVIVESKIVKDHLLGEFAKKGSAFAITFLTQPDFLHFFYPKEAPSHLEVELSIYEKLQKAMEEKREPFAFTNGEMQPCPKHILNLAKELSRLFFSYLALSKDKLSCFLKDEGWQSALFKESFLKNWPLPDYDLAPFYEESAQLHFFCNSNLSENLHEFLKLKKASATHYILSFCKFFWTDTLSDYEKEGLLRRVRQRKELPKDLHQYEEFLNDTNSLLANFGKEQREYLKALEAREALSFEIYSEEEPKSLVQFLKNDLLNFENFKERPRMVLSDDRSLQISSSFSLLREVEALFEKMNSSKAGPSSYLILARDISLYAPYIHHVFGSGPIPYRIFGLKEGMKGEFYTALKAFLELDAENVDSLYALFSKAVFYETQDLNDEEIEQIFSWLYILRRGSMELKVEKILFGALFKEEGPFGNLKISHTALLDKFLKAFLNLKADSQYLSGSKSPKDWALILKKISSSYFDFDEEAQGFLLPFLRKLMSCQGSIAKEELLFFLDEEAKKKTGSYNSSCLEGASFASLSAGSLIPSDNICLLGLDESWPPLKSDPLSFFPKNSEREKHLFLGLFFYAKHLYFSYVGWDETPRLPSLLLEKLLSYIRSAFNLDLSPAKEHALPFHSGYFKEEKELFDLKAYKAARARYERNPQSVDLPAHSLARVKEPPLFLELKDLFAFASNPAKHFLQKRHKIYFDELAGEEEDFLLSPLESYLFKKRALFLKEEEIKERLGNLNLPKGIFGLAALRHLMKDAAGMKKTLRSLGIKEEEIFDYHFRPHSVAGHLSSPLAARPFGKEVKLIGKLEGLSSKGLLLFEEDKREAIIKNLPRLLLFFSLDLQSEPNLIFLKDGKIKRGSFLKNQKALDDFVEYYLKCEEGLTFPIRQWYGLAKFEKKAAEEKFSAALLEDRYLSALFKKSSFASLFENAKRGFEEIYEPMLEELKIS